MWLAIEILRVCATNYVAWYGIILGSHGCYDQLLLFLMEACCACAMHALESGQVLIGAT